MPAAPRETWLTPIAEAWERKMGPGTFAAGIAAGQLGKLKRAGVEPAEIARRLARYLDETPPRFASLARFQQTFNAWAGEQQEEEFEVDEAGVIRE